MTAIPVSFVEKYQPTTTDAIIGQKQAVQLLQQCVQHNKPALLTGPVGCGKTASVYALAKELQYEIVEVNASDFRDKESIQQIVGSSLQQRSLFHRGKIVLVDEVDGIAGREDRGGVQALTALLQEAKQAVVMTANDPWDSKFSSLRKVSQVIEFQPLSIADLVSLLEHVCKKERITCASDVLKKLARKAMGDARAALHDLEALSMGRQQITEEDVAVVDDRLREQSIQDALRLVFKSTHASEVLTAFDAVDSDLPEVFLWLDENLPLEYHGASLAKGYDALSKADVFHGRIMRWQHWRFLVYMNTLMTAGIALAKEQKTPGFVAYKRNSRILRLWMAKQKRVKRQGIMETGFGEIHGSSRRLVYDILPYVIFMLKKNKQKTFGLSKEDIQYLVK